MREYKFRGKRIENGEWVYGYFLVAAGMTFISAFAVRNPILVQPETIGQFTGLRDVNGKEIYEGDVVILNGETALYLDETTIKGQEVFYENGAFWCAWSDGVDTYGGDTLLADVQTKNIEIIGNVHEAHE